MKDQAATDIFGEQTTKHLKGSLLSEKLELCSIFAAVYLVEFGSNQLVFLLSGSTNRLRQS